VHWVFTIRLRKIDKHNSSMWKPIGPYGNARKNERGNAVLNMLQETGMRYSVSYYQHSNYVRLRHFDGQTYSLDHFFTHPRGKKITITDMKVTWNWAQSNHLPVSIGLKIKVKKHAGTRTNKGTTQNVKKSDYDIIKNDNLQKNAFEREIIEAVVRKPTYPELVKIIVEATRKTAEVTAKPNADWFERSKETLIPYARDNALIQKMKKMCCHNKAKPQAARRNLNREK
jgi:hypothetical protein